MAKKTKKEEYYRFFTVTDPRTHEKGHTEYKITARFVSKKRPEDVREVVVWKRYSELKKLHGELSYTHRNLFRRQEEFPSFPRAQIFGRFEEAVIEERRSAAEAMLHFTTNIPALFNSPQLKEFFRGGEVRRPLELSAVSSSSSLPPPLIPLPKHTDVEEEAGREAPLQAQELESSLGENQLVEPEVAVEALSDMEDSPVQERHSEKDRTELNISPEQTNRDQNQFGQERLFDLMFHSNTKENKKDKKKENTVSSMGPTGLLDDESEEFDSLFDSVLEEHVEEARSALSETDLAIFDPCAKEDMPHRSPDHSEFLSLKLTVPDGAKGGGDSGWMAQANSEVKAAQECENVGKYNTAILKYRAAVDILMKIMQEDVDPQQREVVKRRIAECLEHAERLLSLQTVTEQNNT